MHRIALRGTLAALVLQLAACGGGGGGGSAASLAAPGGGSGAPTTNALSGTVRDGAGQPVAGATVTVFHTNTNTSVTALTDANGRYTVSGIGSGANTDYAIYAGLAGYAFAPAPNDAAATAEKLDFNGLYRTVVRIASMPARDVAGADFTAYRAGDKLASLPRTGQSTSYAPGDDGAAARGAAWPAQRFTDGGDGTVTDHLTGLVWLKDAGCLGPADWSAALAAANALASGQCGLADGSTAGQWRLPNVNELESLVDVSRSAPALPAAHPFVNVSATAAYWSSTTYMALTTNAMAIRFTDGRWINGIDPNDGSFDNAKATSHNAVWAVRTAAAPGAIKLLATGVFAGQGGGSFGPRDDAALRLGVQQTSPRFVDNGDGTLSDTVTGLVWLKQGDCLQGDWSSALAAVNALANGQCGLSDGSSAGQWRMPNRAELLSLSDRAPTFPQAAYLDGQYTGTSAVTGPVVFSNFVVSEYYWTSSTDAADAAQAWSVYSCDFGVYNVPKSEVHRTLAVR